MEKLLAQDYTGESRERFLKDNCDKVEEIGYMKPFTAEELDDMKNELAETSIQINDIEEKKKAQMEVIKEQMKPLLEQKAELLTNIKQKSQYVNENCFKFIDYTEGMVGYYNSEGELVECRPIRADERQLTIFRDLRTGTDN